MPGAKLDAIWDELERLAASDALTMTRYFDLAHEVIALTGNDAAAAAVLQSYFGRVSPDYAKLESVVATLERLAASGALTPARFDVLREQAAIAALPREDLLERYPVFARSQ